MDMLLLMSSLFSGLEGTIVSMLRLGGIKGGIVNCVVKKKSIPSGSDVFVLLVFSSHSDYITLSSSSSSCVVVLIDSVCLWCAVSHTTSAEFFIQVCSLITASPSFHFLR